MTKAKTLVKWVGGKTQLITAFEELLPNDFSEHGVDTLGQLNQEVFKIRNCERFYNRIEFWILIFFLIRMIGITNPPLEMEHNWRQVTGLMVARNYVEVNDNIFYPRVDDNNGKTGIIGMEFPAMNYIYFLISELFGYTHWYGR